LILVVVVVAVVVGVAALDEFFNKKDNHVARKK
jgi:hypothetical protein